MDAVVEIRRRRRRRSLGWDSCFILREWTSCVLWKNSCCTVLLSCRVWTLLLEFSCSVTSASDNPPCPGLAELLQLNSSQDDSISTMMAVMFCLSLLTTGSMDRPKTKSSNHRHLENIFQDRFFFFSTCFQRSSVFYSTLSISVLQLFDSGTHISRVTTI